MKRTRCFLALLLFLAAGLSAMAQSRSQPWPSVTPVGQRAHNQFPQPAPQDDFAKIESENARKANAERQLAIKDDTAKLLQMANELQEYVDKTNENILSLEVVKKAEQIEKLAKSVKEKMKANY